MTPRQIAKVDANQPKIVAALRAAGATVLHTHQLGRGAPDLLVGKGGNVNLLLEVKDIDGKLTDDERKFFDTWRGQVTIVRTIEDALRLLEAES